MLLFLWGFRFQHHSMCKLWSNTTHLFRKIQQNHYLEALNKSTKIHIDTYQWWCCFVDIFFCMQHEFRKDHDICHFSQEIALVFVTFCKSYKYSYPPVYNKRLKITHIYLLSGQTIGKIDNLCCQVYNICSQTLLGFTSIATTIWVFQL